MSTRATRHTRCLVGAQGAASTGHPLATSAALRTLDRGGSAVDAAIAAQAVICTVMPQAAGLGGDVLALVHRAGRVTAVNGTGCSPRRAPTAYTTDGGASVTAPGIVDGWLTAHRAFGRLSLAEILQPAVRLADKGYAVDDQLARAVADQRTRISQYGCGAWELLGLEAGNTWRQPELASLLTAIASQGRAAFYAGQAASAIANAVAAQGGSLDVSDLADHETVVCDPVQTAWAGSTLSAQPPSTQGALLAMAARWLDSAEGVTPQNLQHVLVELTEAVFAHRADAAADPDLLERPLEVDRVRAQNRGGPRAYLHTAGAAVADADGMVVSSLLSVFDDFGSGVFVPELGLVLNNRGAGFTYGANAAGPGKRPVHTLAPALLTQPNGDVLALATPGADGQIQTLLQVLARMRFGGLSLSEALTAPRWRSQDGDLLIESDHEDRSDLADRGHHVALRPAGDDLFGAVVAAGISAHHPFAASDWRRCVTTGVT